MYVAAPLPTDVLLRDAGEEDTCHIGALVGVGCLPWLSYLGR